MIAKCADKKAKRDISADMPRAEKQSEGRPPLRKRWRIGVRLLDWSQGFCYRLFPGILEVARSGHDIDLVFEQPSGGDIAPVGIDENWEGDGLLVYRYSGKEAACWRKKGIKVVNLSAEQPTRGPHFPRVTLDNEAVGAMAARHLLTLGLKNFAYWHDPYRRYSMERLAGYRAELAKEGHEPQVIEVPASRYTDDERAAKVAEISWRLLGGLRTPTGLFAKDDISAVCAVKALSVLGLRCPEDVPVVGVADDVVYCHTTRPALSSVRFPGRLLGAKAMQLLIDELSGNPSGDDFRIKVKPSQLVVRESSGHVELPDAVVTRAISFIRRHVTSRAVGADEVGKAAGVSRELLRQRFQATLGRSPKEEIDRQRAEAVCECLRTTTWKMDRIAEQMGFGAADELCRFFKRVHGTTPGEFRKEAIRSGTR